jgi:endonuclease G, mitochondrial
MLLPSDPVASPSPNFMHLQEVTMKTRALLLALLLTFLSSFALAAQSQCPQHYFGGQAPDIVNEKLAQKTQEIGYRKYGIIHSGITRTPLVSGEHLTRQELTRPHAQRKNKFHPEPNLRPEDRAELADYAKSGFDRGHMAPVGDMADERSQYESFSLANMIPQNPHNNRNLWEGIEEATRDLAITGGELYVVTGPVFYGSSLQRLKGRVLVPTYVFKAIYDPAHKLAAAYVTANAAGGRYAVISIAELEKLTGLAIFPAVEDQVKQAPMALPKPTPNTGIRVIEDKTIVPKPSQP